MKNGITRSMKTAISVENELMRQADQAARDLGLSRSALVAEALRTYLRDRRQAQISEQLNKAYADAPGSVESGVVRKLRTKIRVQERW